MNEIPKFNDVEGAAPDPDVIEMLERVKVRAAAAGDATLQGIDALEIAREGASVNDSSEEVAEQGADIAQLETDVATQGADIAQLETQVVTLQSTVAAQEEIIEQLSDLLIPGNFVYRVAGEAGSTFNNINGPLTGIGFATVRHTTGRSFTGTFTRSILYNPNGASANNFGITEIQLVDPTGTVDQSTPATPGNTVTFTISNGSSQIGVWTVRGRHSGDVSGVLDRTETIGTFELLDNDTILFNGDQTSSTVTAS